MKKKLVALILTAAMVLSMSACGASGGGGNASSQAPAPSETQEAVSEEDSAAETADLEEASAGTEAAAENAGVYPIVEEPVTVTGLVVGKDTATRSDRLVWNKVSEVTGINIEWEVIDADALATYLAGGDWPDFIHYNLDSSMVTDYGVVGGRFVNYLDYLDLMPNLVQTFEDYPIAKKASMEINGEMYSLPGIEVSATTVKARPYVRTDVLEAAGLSMPATVEEFHDALAVLKEKNGEAGFIPELSNDESYWGPMLFAAFGPLTNMNFDDDGTGKVVFNRTSEQMRLYLEYMNRLYEEGLIDQEYLTMDGTVRLDRAKSGKVAFIGGGEANSLQASDFTDGEFHLDCCPPLTSEYDSTQEILGNSPYFPSGGFYMNAESEYIEELCRMFDIMYATEEVVEGSGLYGESFCYGMEGVDWDYGPEGSGVYVFHCPEKYDGSFTTYQYSELIWENAGRCDALAGLVTETEGNNRARQQGFVKNVIPYQSDLYFPVDLLTFTEDEQYTLDNRLTDIKTYYKEMEGKFITGVADIETEWDTYCKTLEQMGINEVLEVYQASYDRWNSQ
ncbi:MAG TPA: extracellular solute-binding protein [Candidatus Eisenbergiella merdipullorum]|uniref:Extracellular solute-binding protein n=1 Tax=Candidatus Eisenbergiella merdipullorum TaxID=2838553 RepID=A0A9D2KZD4_9FIRM|nr:extracellular solute-binding protein [Candidatus Eisenbergiella merdipullorum]